MKRFIFDVDGTLTPSRQRINADFQRWFLEFTYDNAVHLVTGSDYPKTVEQVGTSIVENVNTVYNCSGSDVWEAGKNIRSSDWVLPLVEKSFLDGKLVESTFPLRTGLHIENRTGMVNYSIVGRNATMGERKLYASYDNEHNERNKIASEFNNLFPNLQATVGGETGIDIAPRGNDKSQILSDFDSNDELHFFGDAMHKEGNDYPLKRQIIDNDLGMCYTVIDWKHTWELLKQHD